ncbi:Na+/H+ antiporter subunit E [Saccharothrix longispora]|uniref:Multisubunit Na+/H+ antiporter MnhE subunit n=1 Tax=Saccharothrix longispora TaxID=33920 RepID=A0ABU1PU40_9PSEU|nr:Na+/H+ antiporter subunit E [Saccharothrix longispora]MDR6594173.1 multisubunit Na+/H+ antiporter MnhE subunit [Saccharothrix longispora]
MIALLLRVLVLTSVYLLALTSLHPGDVLVGLVLSGALVAVAGRVRPHEPPPRAELGRRLAGVPALVGGTLVDLAVGTWRTAACLVGRGPSAAGLVEVPIPRGGPASAAAWGVRVGFVPDTVVVEVDEERGRMLLHVLDARDPDAVVAGQLDSYRRRQRRVLP